jgi:hypothetical protein
MNAGKKHFFDKPGNVRWVQYTLLVALTLILGLDFFIHKQPYFVWEKWFGFYGIYGFIACAALVLVSRYFIRPLLMRDENYYD